MKLEPPRRPKVRVHELARELRWTPRQLLAELSRRGEFVKSASSTLEAPIVRAIRRDFAPAIEQSVEEATSASTMYGHSARTTANDDTETFAAALDRARSHSNSAVRVNSSVRRAPILQVLLDEIVIPQRPEHLEPPARGHFGWELKQAEDLNARWAEARLNGLDADDAEVVQWIRLSGGRQPEIAARLVYRGITPCEAALAIGYGGRIDARMATVYERFSRAKSIYRRR